MLFAILVMSFVIGSLLGVICTVALAVYLDERGEKKNPMIDLVNDIDAQAKPGTILR